MNKKDFDFKNTLSSRAYTLMVCHRFKKIDEELFGSKEFTKRTVEQLQESENSRMEMHIKAMIELTKHYKFTEEEAHIVLQEECDRLVKEEFGELKEDECFCGCCRVVLKKKDWEKHQKENQLLHDYLYEQLKRLNIEQTKMRINMINDKKLNGVLK